MSQTPMCISSAGLLKELRRKIAILNTDTRQSPVNVDSSTTTVYRVPAKEIKKTDVKKKVAFN